MENNKQVGTPLFQEFLEYIGLDPKYLSKLEQNGFARILYHAMMQVTTKSSNEVADMIWTGADTQSLEWDLLSKLSGYPEDIESLFRAHFMSVLHSRPLTASTLFELAFWFIQSKEFDFVDSGKLDLMLKRY